MTKTQLNVTTNKSQEVSHFPAGEHKAAMNRRESMTNIRHKNTNDPKKKYRLRTVSKNILLEGLNQFHGASFSCIIYPRYNKKNMVKIIYVTFVQQHTITDLGETLPAKSDGLWKSNQPHAGTCPSRHPLRWQCSWNMILLGKLWPTVGNLVYPQVLAQNSSDCTYTTILLAIF